MNFIRLSHSSGVIFDFGAGIQRIDSPFEVSLQCPLCSLAASILEKCLPHFAHIISIYSCPTVKPLVGRYLDILDKDIKIFLIISPLSLSFRRSMLFQSR